jgi:hypothetical protein
MSRRVLTVSAAFEPPVGAAAAVGATARLPAARMPATAMAMLDFFMAELLFVFSHG